MTNWTIRIAEEKDAKRWDAFVDELRGGPYFYWSWKKAVEKAYGHKGLYLLIERGYEILGILPLILLRFPLKRPLLVSLPFCDYGGILAREDAILQILFSKAHQIKDKIGALRLELRFPKPEVMPFISSKQEPIQKVRLILALPQTPDELWKSFKSKVRSQIRRPKKEGAEVVTGGLELLPIFYQIYLENMHYLGSPAHSLRWFKEVVGNFAERARIVVVYKDYLPLASGIILLSADTVTVPWAASRRAYKRISPNMLLYWQFLSFAADHGFKYFDFGRSTPGGGTYRFKKQWGAEPVPLFWYSDPQVPEQVSRIRPLAERVWQKLPPGLVNRLGPQIRRYISL